MPSASRRLERAYPTALEKKMVRKDRANDWVGVNPE